MQDADTTTRRLLAYVAAALVAGGAPVTEAEAEVRRVGAHLGHPGVQVSAFPTTITLALASGAPATVETVEGPLRLDQTVRVGHIRRDLLSGRMSIADAVAALGTTRRQKARYGAGGLYGGLCLVAMGICLIMQPALPNVLLAGLCSLLVCVLVRGAGRHQLLAALLPSVAALAVTVVVLLAEQAGLVHGVLRTIICPIAVLLPGGLLSTGITELAEGAMISGTSRFFHGMVQLLLFTLGVATACEVMGVSPTVLSNTRLAELGVWSAPLGLALIALGLTLSEAVPWSLAPWVVLVLTATFATQLAGQTWGHSMPVGSFLGAVVASLLSSVIEATRANVPRLLTFLPSFWLLVPGTLGLMGITAISAGTGGADALVGVVTVVAAIALGLLVGSAVALSLRRLARALHHRRMLPAHHETSDDGR